MALVEENIGVIESAVDNPEDARLIETKLGIVTSLREVQNFAQ
jgi:hypothetical protein